MFLRVRSGKIALSGVISLDDAGYRATVKIWEDKHAQDFWGFGGAGAASLALPGAASAQTKIVIGIPTSPPNIVHMPPIVAKELGLYKKAGIDAEIVSLGDGTKVFRALAG